MELDLVLHEMELHLINIHGTCAWTPDIYMYKSRQV